MSGPLRFRSFGGLLVQGHDGGAVDLGGPKQRTVLAVLLLEAGRAVAPQRLVDLVWGDDPPDRADVSLQAYVSNLRRALEPDRPPRRPPRVLLTRPAGYLLAVASDQVDVGRFEESAAAGHRALHDGDPTAAAALLDAALAERAGDLLPELAGEAWVVAAARRLDRICAAALEDRFEAGLALGEHRGLVARIEAAVAQEPYRERLRAQLALALYRSGRQRDALASLQEARRALVDDAGLEPGPELRRLEADMLAQSPSLDHVVGSPDRRRRTDPAWARTGVDRRRSAGAAHPEPGPTGDARRMGDRSGLPLMGRSRELRALLAAHAATSTRGGRAVVVSGEAGIGKTRLVEELVTSLPEAAVAWGRCPEHATHAAYWPCIQIGRQLEGAGVLAGDLVRELLPDDDLLLDDTPGVDRLWLHHGITRSLASANRPLMLVIEDLQWADPGSLRVIEFVAGELSRLPLLLVVTTRPVGPDAGPALVDCLAELARQPGALRLELGGLVQADVARWVDERSGGAADPALAGLVHDRTGGNPFFVGEVVELLVSEDRLRDPAAARRGAPVPAAVADVVRRRVGRLPAASQQLLVAASVLGRSFDLDLVAAVSGVDDPGAVLDLLEAPIAAGLVEEGEVPGRFQFSHALVADALAAESSPVRRARLHAEAFDAVLRLRDADLDDHEAALAHHAFAGMAAGTAAAAHQWSVRAARSASASLAHEDAAEHWDRAARAVEAARPADLAARFQARFEQGRAHLRTGSAEPARRALSRAVEIADAMGDAARTQRARDLLGGSDHQGSPHRC